MFATITGVIQYRRISVLTLGVWIGAAVFADIAVTQNFQTVDRFLQAPGTPAAEAALKAMGPANARALLRRNAAEENNFLFVNAERAQIVLGVAVTLLLACELQPSSTALIFSLALTVIALVQHFALTPQIASLARLIEGLPPGDAMTARFWMLHGIYSGAEILKLVGASGLALVLCAGSSKRNAAYVG